MGSCLMDTEFLNIKKVDDWFYTIVKMANFTCIFPWWADNWMNEGNNEVIAYLNMNVAF